MKDGWNIEYEGAIARLTINRPGHMNALNTAMLRDLDAILDDLERKADLRAVEVTGHRSCDGSISVGRGASCGRFGLPE